MGIDADKQYGYDSVTGDLNSERVAMKLYGSQAGWYYFINDHPGTPQKIVNEAGKVVWAGFYQPFGKVFAYPAAITNNFRFPGQYSDEETGLHYNWHRYYDPGTGRYLTPDPIGLGGGVNLYGYVGGNPINRSDPFGLIELILVGSNVKNPDFFTNIANAWANENTEVVQIRSLDEFQDTLRNHKSIEKLIYLGHAGNNRLFLSPTGILRTEDVAGLETKNVLPGAKIELNGCHTAESDTKTPLSITAVFARHFKRDVSGYISGLSFGLPVYNIFDDDTLQPLFILFPSYPRGRQITVFGE